MPIFGQLDSASRGDAAPRADHLAGDDDVWTSAGVDILTFTYEVDTDSAFKVIPKALHPSLPPYITIVFRIHVESPFGPLITAEVNLRARSTIHQVGYTLAAFTDNAGARDWLRDHYGYPSRIADLRVSKRYTGVVASIAENGKTLFAGELRQPHFIAPTDVLFTPSMSLAWVDGALMLVQQELEYTLEKAQRGTAHVGVFDAKGLGEPAIHLANALPPTLVHAQEVRYETVRFLVDPEQPAMAGTRDLQKQAS